MDFLTDYVLDPDLSRASAVQRACGLWKPLPSDIRIDDLPFFACRPADYRGLTDVRFVAVVRPHGEEDSVLRQLTFDIYAKPGELPAHKRRLQRLASKLHEDAAPCR